jgi:hypothetical protein
MGPVLSAPTSCITRDGDGMKFSMNIPHSRPNRRPPQHRQQSQVPAGAKSCSSVPLLRAKLDGKASLCWVLLSVTA